LPSHADVPLARFTIPELRREVLARGIVAQISGVTVWRWLSADALQPWRHRSWIFPRDAQFAEKAGHVLDLYARTWDGRAPRSDEFVVSADEKPSLQARRRKHPTLAPGPARPMRVEHEYFRTGALTYLAGMGCTSRETLWPVRTQDDHWRGRPACRAGDDLRALSLRAARLLDRRQLLVPPGRESGRPILKELGRAA
jgi:hypothetical protein